MTRRFDNISNSLQSQPSHPAVYLLNLAHLVAGVPFLFAMLACCAQQADAAIVSTSGAASEISPPASVFQGALESNSVAVVFLEKANLTLSTDLEVNTTSPGTYTGNNNPTVNLSAGHTIASYLVHMDQVGTSGSTSYVGSITFDTDVLAIIWSQAKLNATDSLLGSASVSYPTGVSGIERGSIDSSGTNDTIELSADRRTVSFDLLHNSNNIEQFRIITEIPEPHCMLLLLTSLAVMPFSRHH